jgi:TPR repeat protein
MPQEPSPPAILPTAASPVQQRVIAASQPAGGAAAHPNNDVALPSSPTATAGDLQPSARSPQLKQAAAVPAPAAVSSAAVAPRGNTAATPAIAQPSPAVARELSVLLARGDAMLALGDVVTARLFYQRAATLGSARAAMAAGKTYDSAFLASIDATGIIPDRAAADFWYRKGAALGYRATGGLADMAGAPGDR